jgi:hypothetical protein
MPQEDTSAAPSGLYLRRNRRASRKPAACAHVLFLKENSMPALTASLNRRLFLRSILYADAATCFAMALFLVLLAQPLAGLLGLPALLLELAGAALFPIGAFIAWAASSARGIAIVIGGNLAWVGASLALLVSGRVEPTPLGYGFVLVQAAAVALLAVMEYAAYRKR